jgi:hypothetical protein
MLNISTANDPIPRIRKPHPILWSEFHSIDQQIIMWRTPLLWLKPPNEAAVRELPVKRFS